MTKIRSQAYGQTWEYDPNGTDDPQLVESEQPVQATATRTDRDDTDD